MNVPDCVSCDDCTTYRQQYSRELLEYVMLTVPCWGVFVCRSPPATVKDWKGPYRLSETWLAKLVGTVNETVFGPADRWKMVKQRLYLATSTYLPTTLPLAKMLMVKLNLGSEGEFGTTTNRHDPGTLRALLVKRAVPERVVLWKGALGGQTRGAHIYTLQESPDP